MKGSAKIMKDYMDEASKELLRAADSLRGLYSIGVCRIGGEIHSAILTIDPEVDGNGLRLNAILEAFTSRIVTDEERERLHGKHPKDFVFVDNGNLPMEMFPEFCVGCNDVLINTHLAADGRLLPGVDKEILEHTKLSNERLYFPDEVENLEKILGVAGLKRVPLEQVKESSLDKPLVHTSLNDLSMLAFVEQQKWAINVALDMKGMYPLGVVTGFTADDPSVVSVLELNPTVIGNLIKLDPIFTMFWPFTLDERDTREHRNIPCDGIDVESDSGKVWVLDDYTASGDDGPSVLNRIPSLADTFFPGINYGAINRIRVPDDGVLTPGEAEELLNSLTSAGLQKTEPKFVVMGREDCIWNTMHTSLNSAMDFYEEAVRAAGRGEER